MNKTNTSGHHEQEMKIPPHTGKKEVVRQMFDSIARRYDFLNHFLSLGIDRLWRKKTIRIIQHLPHKTILDVATGTGDMSILASRLETTSIVGIDISSEMLEIQKMKLESKKLNAKITVQIADAENLPFEKESFDVIMTAFGVRNFENLDKGLSEFHRVLKNGGHVVILEFSKPTAFFVKGIFKFYFSNILPLLGRMVSRHNFAYSYLPDSVDRFPSGADFSQRLNKAGFVETNYKSLSFGIASIYTGKK